MKKTSDSYLKKTGSSSQIERLKAYGVKAFSEASAYGCGRNPIDMRTLQKTGETPAFITVKPVIK